MEYALKLKTVDIKTLSREDLEAAYLRLLKVSLMKTKLIEYMETLMNHRTPASRTNVLGRNNQYAEF